MLNLATQLLEQNPNRSFQNSLSIMTALAAFLLISGSVTAPVAHGATLHGATEGTGSVTSRGYAEYSIPLTVPEGVGGLSPVLELKYSSKDKPSSAGQGWSLSAGEQIIHRCKRTVAQDGIASGISHTTDDRLCINGQRLVAISGTYGISGAEYRTEIASFRRIQSFGPAGQAPNRFVATTPDGMVYRFGYVATGNDARIQVSGSPITRVWALGRVEDPYTNFMDYTYIEQNTTGEYYLDEIKYTGQITPNRATNFRIKPIFEVRPDDVRTLYEAGSPVTQSRRLKTLETYSGSVLVRRYNLDYEIKQAIDSGRSRLAQVTECAYDTLEWCFSPTTITWQESDSGWESTTVLPAANNGDRFLTGDWDGDGLNDLFVGYQTSSNGEYRAKWKISLGKDDFFGTPVSSDVPAHLVETSGPFSLSYKYRIMDYNGDGRSDILMMRAGQAGIEWLVYQSTGNPANPFTQLNTGISVNDGSLTPANQALVIDYNNDGLDDLVRAGGGIVGYRNLGGSFTQEVITSGGYTIPDLSSDGDSSQNLVTFSYISSRADFNDDGIPDLRVKTLVEDPYFYFNGGEDEEEGVEFRQGWAYLQSNGTGYDVIKIFNENEDEPEILEFVDINGDGLSDRSYDVPVGNGVYEGRIEVNTGDGFKPPVLSAASPVLGASNVWEWTEGDVNNDGRADRVFRNQSDSVYVMISNGSSLEAPVLAGTAKESITLIDMNGDGNADLLSGSVGTQSSGDQGDIDIPDPCLGIPPSECNYVLPRPATVQPGPQVSSASLSGLLNAQIQPHRLPSRSATSVQIRLHKSPLPDVAKRISDGFGNFIEFTYTPIATSGSYDLIRSNLVPPFVQPMWAGKHAVTSALMNDGIGGVYTSTYSYTDAFIETRGRGSLGYSSVSKTDSRNGIINISNFRQDHPFIGRVKQRTALQPNGSTKIADSVVTWTSKAYGGQSPQRYFVYEDYEVQQAFEVEGSLNGVLNRSVTFDPTYNLSNEYGNLTSVVESITSPHAVGDIYTTTVNVSPSDSAGFISNWCLNLPESVTVTRSQTVGGASSSESRKVDYSPNANFCRVDGQTNYSDQLDKYKSITEVLYDDRGNPGESVLKGAPGVIYENGVGFTEQRSLAVFDAQKQYPEYAISCFANSGAACISYPHNPRIRRVWDAAIGQVVESYDHLNNKTDRQYEPFGRLKREDRPDGSWTTFSYSPCNISCGPNDFTRVIKLDSEGATTVQYLDSFGRETRFAQRVLTQSGSAFTVKIIEFDALGREHRVSNNHFGNDAIYWTQYDYDLIGRPVLINQPISESIPSGRNTTIFYEGLIRRVVDANDIQTSQEFSPRGHVVKAVDAANEHISYQLSPWGAVLTTINGTDGSTITNTYDPPGRLASTNDPDKGLTEYRYNPAGALIWRRDAKSQVATFEYDSLGRITKRSEPEGVSNFTFNNTNSSNGFGQLHSLENYDSHKVTHAYDNLGRILRTDRFIPNRAGFLAAGLFSIDYQYDSLGRLSTLTYPQTDSMQPTRFAVKYAYEAGHLRSVSNNADSSEVFYRLEAMDAMGNSVNESYGNEIVTTRQIDRANNRLDGIVSGLSGGAEVQNLSYEWDAVGNFKQRLDNNKNLIEIFQYDDLYRIESSTLNGVSNLSMDYFPNGNISFKSGVGDEYIYAENGAGPHAVTTIKQGGAVQKTFAYDANGNMINRNGNVQEWSSYNKPTVLRSVSAASEIHYGADRSRYRQVEWRNNVLHEETLYVGGLFERIITRMPQGSTDTIGYRHYVFANGTRVAAKNSLEAVGDSDGDGIPDALDNCIDASNSNQRDTNGDGFGNSCDPDLDNNNIVNFVDVALWSPWFLVSNPDPDVDFNGDNQANFSDYMLYGTFYLQPPGPAGNLPVGESTVYYHQDHSSSIETVTDYNGNVIAQYSYDPFGQRRSPIDWKPFSAGTNIGSTWEESQRGFTDHEHMDDLGLIHMNGRVYDPEIGRVISADPFIQDLGNTQSFNRYSYVRNNPLTLNDPSGYLEEVVVTATRGSGGGGNIFLRFGRGLAGGLGFLIRAVSERDEPEIFDPEEDEDEDEDDEEEEEEEHLVLTLGGVVH